MSTQTGSISFEATGGFNSYAKQNYATLSQIKGQFATCGTGAATAAKVATIVPADSGWTLYEGATVTVKFTSKNTAATPTLNVNNTGAKQIRDYNGDELTKEAREWLEGSTMALTYDGTYWRIQDSNLMERVHSAETGIEQNANSIVSFASMEDNYTDPNGNTVVNKAKSYVDQTAEGITTTISNVSERVDKLQIGGRNLLKERTEDYSVTTNGLTFEYDATTHILHVSGTNTKTSSVWTVSNPVSTALTASLEPGEDYTLTAYDLGGFFDSTLYVQLNTYISSGTQVGDWSVGSERHNPSHTNVVRDTHDDHDKWANLFIGVPTTIGSLDVYVQFKFEKGNMATDWSPSPETVSASITTITNTVNSVKSTADTNSAHLSNLTQTLGTNADGTTKTNDIVHKYNNLDQTLDGTLSTVGAMIDSSVTGANILTGNALNPFNWTVSAPDSANYTKTAYGTTGVEVEFTGVSGWEWLYSPAITVKSGHSYTLSVEYTVGVNYTTASGRGGFGLSVYSSAPPFSSYDVSNSAFLGRAQFFETKTSKVIKATITFTATSTAIYLGLNGGQIADSSIRLSFTMNNLKLVENIDSRMSSAETSISQTANAIGLTATGTATISNPNLTPWFSISVDDTSYWAGLHVRNGSVSNSEGLHAIYDALNYKDGIGWAHITLDSRTSAGNNGSTNCYMNMFLAKDTLGKFVKPSGKYTWLIEVSDLNFVGANSSSALHVLPSINNNTMDVFSLCDKAFTASGSATAVVTAKSSFTSLTQDTRGYCYIPTGCYADFYLRISLYEGEYTGLYKPYVGSQLYASQAELKVTADGISSTVSKISGIKYFDTTYSYSLANIKMYSTNGYSGGWNVTTSTDGTRVGDVVYLKVHDTTRNCDVYIKGTVKTVNSSTRLTITSHGYEDTLPVDTIKSTINQSADSVKIQAKHIEIDGTATFKNSDNTTTTLGNYLSSNYDAAGAANNALTDAKSYTDTNAAPKTSAVSRSQRIYYQSNSTTKPATPGTASSNWVTDETGAADKWTLKRMSYSSTKPYIYTCEQKQVVSGIISYTPVLLDDTTTVIDGGKIITGSIAANKLDVYDASIQKIKASAIDTNSISIGQSQVDGLDKSFNTMTSKGEQLVANGNAFLGDNTNFSTMTYVGNKAINGSSGAFTNSLNYYAEKWTDEYFPIDGNGTYVAECDVLCASSNSKWYGMLGFYDIDGNVIQHHNWDFVTGSTTTLAQQLKNGDTKVYLTSVAGFSTTYATNNNGLTFWNWKNSKGYQYPAEIYSRNSFGGLWTAISAIDRTNNTITLSNAWSNGTYAAGTSVSQRLSGNTYEYFGYFTSNAPTTWKHYSGIYSPTGPLKISPAAAKARVGFLWNYQTSASSPGTAQYVTNVSVMKKRVTDNEVNNASKIASNYIHADSTGINIYDNSLTNANKYYLRQTAGGTYIYRNTYLKAKYEDTITLYGGSNTSGANPKVELTSTDFKMTDSGGTQRLLLNSSSGAIIGHPSKGRTQITDAGMTVYDTNNKKRTTINASGLTVYDASEVDVGNFAATARVGKTNSSRFLMNADSLQAYNSSNAKYFEVDANGITYGSFVEKTITTATDFNTLKTTGTYHIKVSSNTNAPTTGHGVLTVEWNVGTPYQIWQPDSTTTAYYKRKWTSSDSTWTTWTKIDAVDAAKTASNYMKFDSTNGLIIAQSSPSTTAYPLVQITPSSGIFIKQSAMSYSKITSSSMEIYVPVSSTATKVASFGTTATIGQTSTGRVEVTSTGVGLYNKNNKMKVSIGTGNSIFYGGEGTYPYIELGTTATSAINIRQSATSYTSITSSGLDIYTTVNSAATKIASFGTTATIGATNNAHFIMAANKLQAFSSTDTTHPYFEVSASAMKYGSYTVANTGDVTNAGNTASLFITPINDNEIKLHSKTGKASNNYAKMNSDGLWVYKQNNLVAKFSDSITLGKEASTRVEVDFNSFRMLDKNGNKYCHISDLRDESGGVYLEEEFVVPDSAEIWPNFEYITSTIVIYYNQKSYTYSSNAIRYTTTGSTNRPIIKLNTSVIPVGSTITVKYLAIDDRLKGYTFGIRDETNSDKIGGLSFSEGYHTSAIGHYSHSEGDSTTASGRSSHAQGASTTASGANSHAEGWRSVASGEGSHAEGGSHFSEWSIASGSFSHAEGVSKASGSYSHAEGGSTAKGDWSHAEGEGTANGSYSHAEGNGKATGSYSHAEGSGTASGYYSHASGAGTIAGYDDQFVCGKYNSNQSTSLFEIGNGTNSKSANALVVDTSGNLTTSGTITANKDLAFGNGTTATLIAKTPSRTAGVLWVGGSKKAAGDANGTVVRLQGGGLMLVGGGEYPTNRYNLANLNDGDETLFLGSDGAVYVETNGQTIANRKTFTFGADGTFNSPSTIKQNGTAVSLSGTSLFENASGRFSGKIDFSETAANFTFIEIYCKDNDGRYCYTKVWSPNGKTVNVTQTLSYGGNFYIKSKAYTISGAGMDTANTSGIYHTGEVNAAGSNSGSSSDILGVVKVIGYK